MTGILKVDQWKDSGDNALISSDGSGNLSMDANITSTLRISRGVPSIKLTDTDNNADAFIQGTDGNLRFFADDGQESASSNITFSIDGSEISRFTPAGLHLGGTGSANALDDYEEGTYSGEFRDSNGVVPSQTAVGHYVKIGNQVTVHGQVSLTGSTSGTGITFITLPFTVKSNARGGMGIGLVTGGIISMSSNNKTLHLIPEINTTPMYIVETDYTGSHTHLTFNSNFGSGGIFSYSGSYITN